MDRRRVFLDRLVAWSPVLLLGGLAALTYWLDTQVQAPGARADGATRHDPDLFLENFRALTFDAKGQLREELSATRARHFPDDQSSVLQSPKLMLTETGHPTLTLTADKGTIAGDRDSGVFTGNVKVTRDADPHPPSGRPSGPVTLTTDSLHVLAKEQQVDTDAPVTIQEPRGIIRSQGLSFDNKARTLTLKSRVSGTFQPQEPPR